MTDKHSLCDCLIQAKKAKGRAPANDRQYKDSERSVEDDY